MAEDVNITTIKMNNNESKQQQHDKHIHAATQDDMMIYQSQKTIIDKVHLQTCRSFNHVFKCLDSTRAQ